MGVVYRAHDRRARARRRAQAGARPTGDPDETLATRLLREAQALAQLSHPNVVAVYDVGRVDGGVFIAMEFVDGETGDEWLRERPAVARGRCAVFRDAGARARGGARGRPGAPRLQARQRDGRHRRARARARLRAGARARGSASPATRRRRAGSIADEPRRGRRQACDARRDARRRTVVGRPSRGVGAVVDALVGASPARDAADAGGRDRRHAAVHGARAAPRRRATTRAPISSASASRSTRRSTASGRSTAPDVRRAVEPTSCTGEMRAAAGERDGAGVAARDRAARARGRRPTQRWPSMDALLDALGARSGARGAGGSRSARRRSAARRRRRRRRRGAACTRSGACAAAPSASWRGVWDDARKAAVQRRVRQDRQAVRRRRLRRGDARARRLRARAGSRCTPTPARRRACAASSRAELLDLRMECLQRRLDDVRAHRRRARGRRRRGRRARRRARRARCRRSPSAPTPRRCARRCAPPADAKTARARRCRAASRSPTVHALSQAGRYDAGQDSSSRRSSTEAHAHRLAPARGRGAARTRRSSPTRPATIPTRAKLPTTTPPSPPRPAATTRPRRSRAIGLVWVTGERLGKYDEAQDARARRRRRRSSGSATATCCRRRPRSRRWPRSSSRRASTRRPSSAASACSRSARSCSAPDDSADRDGARRSRRRQVQLGALRRGDRATTARASRSPRRRSAARIPRRGSLHVNLGAALRSSGRSRRGARRAHKRAQAIIERSLGRDHPLLATIAINYRRGAARRRARGRGGDAVQARARDLDQARSAPIIRTGTAWFRLGNVALKQGRAAEARADYQKTLDIWKAKLGAEHPSVAVALDGRGDALLAEGKIGGGAE